MFSFVFTILIILTTLVVVTGFLIRTFLRKPLNSLNEIVSSYASGVYDSPGHGIPYLEFQPIGNVLAQMGDKIIEQFKDIREAEEKYRIIFENAVEGIYQTTPEGRFMSASPSMADMLGYENPDELISSISDIAEQLYIDSSTRNEFLSRLSKGDTVSDFEIQLRRKDQKAIWVSLHARAVRDLDGNLCFVEGFAIDITDRKRAEEELNKHREHLEELVKERTAELTEANIRLQEFDQLKSMFLASMSHELRTPLNSIIGFTSWLLMGMEGDLNERQTKQLTMAKGSADHLLSLINDILDISKIESGKVDLFIKEFEITEVVNEVTAAVLPQVKNKGLELRVDVPEKIKLNSDKLRVKQVLLNIVNNAVKFTDSGSVLIQAKTSENNNLEIGVIDSGIGIKKEDMDKLFQPFQQIDMSSTKEHEGTGLGLYLCRKLLDLLHGDITVKSEYGKGSEVKVTLPLKLKNS